MDPYVKASIDSKSLKSKVHHNGGKNPSWSDTLTFTIKNEGWLNLEIWDKDTFTKDDLVIIYKNVNL
jgi:Ca2+-dependent lipid-binding protein